MRRALLVMAKQPLAGRTKTRLVPPFSPASAADLYHNFLLDALDQARAVPGVTPIVAYTPSTASAFFERLAPDLDHRPQQGAALGERLAHVLSAALAAGYEQVAAVNSDSPNLPVAYLAEAFARLDDPATDVVLGPCDDGGYYLIGWKRPHPRLVREVEMSTPGTLQDTLTLANAEGLRVSLLPAWYDVDTVADLARLEADLARDPAGARHTRRFLQAAARAPDAP